MGPGLPRLSSLATSAAIVSRIPCEHRKPIATTRALAGPLPTWPTSADLRVAQSGSAGSGYFGRTAHAIGTAVGDQDPLLGTRARRNPFRELAVEVGSGAFPRR
jgi:hypothetical protein